MSSDDENNAQDDDKLEPIESPETKEFDDVVLKDPESAEYIRTED